MIEIENLLTKSDLFTFYKGMKNAKANLAQPPERAQKGCLCFCTNKVQFEKALASGAHILVVSKNLEAEIKNSPLSEQQAILITPQISLAMAKVLQSLDKKRERFLSWSSPHPTAVIHKDAKVAPTAIIGPCAVIGARAEVAAGAIIGPHTIIENDVSIGENSLLHGHVFVGAYCEIGRNCEVHPHTTIGSDGYGYATDTHKQHHKISQIGRVVIEDDVEIGSHCAIDRATMTETKIGSMTKLDNFCHIAHNCQIGKGCLITAGFIVAGSTTIGDYFVCGGRCSVTDHVNITSGVQLAGESVVTKDITKSGAYGGHPLQPLKDYLRTTSSSAYLPEMRKQLNALAEKLNLK